VTWRGESACKCHLAEPFGKLGDRSHDIVGAQSHSLPSIGLTWGIGSTKELRDAGAESIVEVAAELAGSVKQLLGDASDRAAGAARQTI
jgi:phosphoglycolate phosphatase